MESLAICEAFLIINFPLILQKLNKTLYIMIIGGKMFDFKEMDRRSAKKIAEWKYGEEYSYCDFNGWEKEKKERYRELKELQAQNGPDYINLARADFPTTADDLTFTERIELQTAGYAPYKDASSYSTPFSIEKDDKYSRQQDTSHSSGSGTETQGSESSTDAQPTESARVVTPGGSRDPDAQIVYLR